MFQNENYYHIDYLGEAGITEICLSSLYNLIQTHTDFNTALLLTSDQNHALLLKDSTENYYIVRSGFTSGYLGEGPKGLAKALTILRKHQIETEEVVIPAKLLYKLNKSFLTDQDIDFIFQQESFVLSVYMTMFILSIAKSNKHQI